jgi:hypothetical protein
MTLCQPPRRRPPFKQYGRQSGNFKIINLTYTLSYFQARPLNNMAAKAVFLNLLT